MPKDKIDITRDMLRLNNKIISSTQEPIYTKSVSSVGSPVYVNNTSGAASACYSGVLFSAPIPTAATTFTNAAAYFTYQITNPPGSSKSIYMYRFLSFSAGTGASTTVTTTFYRSATMSTTWTGGTLSLLGPVNRNLGMTNESVLLNNIKYLGPVNSSGISSGTILTNIVQTISTNPMIQFDYNGDIIVPPGYSLTVEVHASATITMTLVFSWWEN